ncbi:MAG: hypothetical protein ACO31I_03005 [Prochlorotrichaceae cyanobacterium]|jgi:hypothetical protein
MRLKSHESPRKGGRNTKGRGGAARQRQLKKRSSLLVKKLKQQNERQSNKKAPMATELGGFSDLRVCGEGLLRHQDGPLDR